MCVLYTREAFLLLFFLSIMPERFLAYNNNAKLIGRILRFQSRYSLK